MTLLVLCLSAAAVLAGIAYGVRLASRARSLDGDAPAVTLALACEHLPADRTEWGRAMQCELACIDGRSARWRFALGGIRAALMARLVGGVTGRPSAAVIVGGAALCAGLAVTAFATYPTLLSERLLPLLVIVLVVVLIGYAVLATAQAREVGASQRRARRFGLLSGAVLGAAWLVFAAAWWNLHGSPLIAALLIPVVAGAYGARTGGGSGVGVRSVVWAGLVAGLVVFSGLTVDAFASAAGPYDAGQLDEFAHSGAASLPAYRMGENLAVATMLLLAIPLLTIASGSLGALVGAGRRRVDR